jgi:CDP-diacylglycerol--glycerol-3-phosphate 3-phosphatidyltransferase
MMNIPLILTYMRVGFIPLIVLFYYLPFEWAHLLTVVLFIVAAITDWLDGYLARNWKQTTKLGAFLDPVADKLLVATVLVILVDQIRIPVLLAVPSIVIIGREILVSALREWMAEIGKRSHIDVVKVAKYKTLLQMVGITFLLYYNLDTVSIFNQLIFWIGFVIFYSAAVLTIWSMCIYLKLARMGLTSAVESE